VVLLLAKEVYTFTIKGAPQYLAAKMAGTDVDSCRLI
jgi:hypothetical protein